MREQITPSEQARRTYFNLTVKAQSIVNTLAEMGANAFIALDHAARCRDELTRLEREEREYNDSISNR